MKLNQKAVKKLKTKHKSKQKSINGSDLKNISDSNLSLTLQNEIFKIRESLNYFSRLSFGLQTGKRLKCVFSSPLVDQFNMLNSLIPNVRREAIVPYEKFNYINIYNKIFPFKLATENTLNKINYSTIKLHNNIQFFLSGGELAKSLNKFSKLSSPPYPDSIIFDNHQKINTISSNKNEIQLFSEDQCLEKEFKNIHLLNLDSTIMKCIEQRMKEVEKCLKVKLPLATIVLCGSILEGILFGIAKNNPKIFNSANSSPKDDKRKVKSFRNWSLSNLIDVAKEIGLLEEDVKQFSHVLRNFRNYIHPYQQASQKFNPSEHTAKMCFQVLKVAIHQITKKHSRTLKY